MKLYAQNAQGYVYAVSVMGTTGERKAIPPEIAEIITKARSLFPVPVALGFGLKNPAQLDGLPEKPDAAVFGSALIKHIDAGGEIDDFLRPWRKFHS